MSWIKVDRGNIHERNKGTFIEIVGTQNENYCVQTSVWNFSRNNNCCKFFTLKSRLNVALTLALGAVRQVVSGRVLRACIGCRRKDIFKAATSPWTTDFSLRKRKTADLQLLLNVNVPLLCCRSATRRLTVTNNTIKKPLTTLLSENPPKKQTHTQLKFTLIVETVFSTFSSKDLKPGEFLWTNIFTFLKRTSMI